MVRARPRRKGLLIVAVAVGAAMVVAACSGGRPSSAPPTTPVPSSTTSTTAQPRGKGPLQLGVLLPTTGPNAALGQSLMAAVDLAISEINEAGGVNGREIDVFRNIETTDTVAGDAVLDSLVNDERVDAVVGPASGRTALSAIDFANESHVVTCSPTAKTFELSAYPSNRFFFRTMPSDELEALALARLMISSTGPRATSLVYSDDEYGKMMANLVRAEVLRNGVQFTAASFEPGATSLEEPVRQALAVTPQAIAVIASADDGARILAELRAPGSSAETTPLFVTDTMRRPDLASKLLSGRADVLRDVQGVSPVASAVDPGFATRLKDAAVAVSPGNFAAYAYDCVNTIALAAQAAGSNEASRFVDQLVKVSRVGSICHDFPSCSKLLTEQRDIDYDGQSGAVELTSGGDVESGRFEVFRFDQQGRDVSDGATTVSR